MNKDNYVSMSVAQRLVENGIVLKTDAVWHKYDWGINGDKWDTYYTDKLTPTQKTNAYPAPCFAELWSELAKYKASCYHSNMVTLAVIEGSPSFYSINPADALAELLIYVKGQEKV